MLLRQAVVGISQDRNGFRFVINDRGVFHFASGCMSVGRLLGELSSPVAEMSYAPVFSEGYFAPPGFGVHIAWMPLAKMVSCNDTARVKPKIETRVWRCTVTCARSLGLTIATKDGDYAAIEAHDIVAAGMIAFFIYATIVSKVTIAGHDQSRQSVQRCADARLVTG